MFLIILSQKPSITKIFTVWVFFFFWNSHTATFIFGKYKDPITTSSHCVKKKTTSNSWKMAFKRKLEHALKLIEIHMASYQIPT